MSIVLFSRHTRQFEFLSAKNLHEVAQTHLHTMRLEQQENKAVIHVLIKVNLVTAPEIADYVAHQREVVLPDKWLMVLDDNHNLFLPVKLVPENLAELLVAFDMDIVNGEFEYGYQRKLVKNGDF